MLFLLFISTSTLRQYYKTQDCFGSVCKLNLSRCSFVRDVSCFPQIEYDTQQRRYGYLQRLRSLRMNLIIWGFLYLHQKINRLRTRWNVPLRGRYAQLSDIGGVLGRGLSPQSRVTNRDTEADFCPPFDKKRTFTSSHFSGLVDADITLAPQLFKMSSERHSSVPVLHAEAGANASLLPTNMSKWFCVMFLEKLGGRKDMPGGHLKLTNRWRVNLKEPA